MYTSTRINFWFRCNVSFSRKDLWSSGVDHRRVHGIFIVWKTNKKLDKPSNYLRKTISTRLQGHTISFQKLILFTRISTLFNGSIRSTITEFLNVNTPTLTILDRNFCEGHIIEHESHLALPYTSSPVAHLYSKICTWHLMFQNGICFFKMKPC